MHSAIEKLYKIYYEKILKILQDSIGAFTYMF